MKNTILKIILLPIIFVAALLFFGRVHNDSLEEVTAEMKDASLPLVSLKTGDYEINRLHGYTGEMNLLSLRDTITPMGTDRRLTVLIDTKGAEISGISYAIRSLDTTRLIENTPVENFEKNEDRISMDIQIKNLIDDDTEYVLVISLETGNQTVSYYTRVISSENLSYDKIIAFVQDFHEKTFEKEAADELSPYLETEDTGTNDGYLPVTIKSSPDAVTWGNLLVERITDSVLSLEEINVKSASATYTYIVSIKDGNGKEQYFTVEEFYRVRYDSNSKKMYLLAFERNIRQFFDSEEVVLHADGIDFGIQDTIAEALSNENETIYAFVCNKELYTLNTTNGKLIRIFGFHKSEEYEERNDYRENDIRILNVDETGNIEFVCYGYMNRGNHEGKVGLAAYRFDSASNAYEELLFLPFEDSYQYLRKDFNELLYLNENDQLFFKKAGTIYRLSLENCRMDKLAENLSEDVLKVSEDENTIAWQKSDMQNATEYNLEKNTEFDVSVATGERIIPLGYIGDDFIYGIVKESDIYEDISGKTMIPMYSIIILDENNEVVMEYQQEGIYTIKASIEDHTVQLERVQKTSSGFEPVSQDNIVSNDEKEKKKVKVEIKSDGHCKMQLKEDFSEMKCHGLTAKEVVTSNHHAVEMETETKQENLYYVYYKGKLQNILENEAEAVTEADENGGVVIGSKGQYIWERGNYLIRTKLTVFEELPLKSYTNTIDGCKGYMLQSQGAHTDLRELSQEAVYDVLCNGLEEADVLNLSGCRLENMMYYISKGSPVFTMVSENNAALMIGYDELNIYLLDPMSASTYKLGINEAEEEIQNAGNVFVTFLPSGI